MKTIKSLKDITTLEIDDIVVFGDLEYRVAVRYGYFIYLKPKDIGETNDKIFRVLNISERNFVENLGINILPISGSFPETKSLEALTALVSALFKEFEKQNELPKTWEEFCKRNPIKKEECWIECFNGKILKSAGTKIEGKHRDPEMDKNVCASEQEAEAFLALMQLRLLRKVYIKDWEPDWNCVHDHYSIIVCQGKLVIRPRCVVYHTLSFPTHELAEQFFNNFKDLLEIAKPLL